jgi:2,3-bisphosphoglycerate-dependent phosphoglycerate mutase
MNNIFLIRHGETSLNVARVLQPPDTPLSERGLAQAESLARRLKEMNVVAIISSDLPRALRTAELISAATGAPIETTPLLQERNFGDWRGLSYDGLGINPLTMNDAPPGGESSAAFEHRIAQAFARVVAGQSKVNGNIAVVTHGLVIRAMLGAHVLIQSGIEPPEHLGNTSLSVFDAARPYLASLVNCTTHLDATTNDDVHALSGG